MVGFDAATPKGAREKPNTPENAPIVKKVRAQDTPEKVVFDCGGDAVGDLAPLVGVAPAALSRVAGLAQGQAGAGRLFIGSA